MSARPKLREDISANGETSSSKKKVTTIDDVLKGLVDWLCAQLKKPSHPSRGIPTAVNCLATLLKEPLVRSSFVQADGVKLLVPLISPASTQQSMQVNLSHPTKRKISKNHHCKGKQEEKARGDASCC